MKIKNKLLLFAFRQDWKFGKWELSAGIYSKRVLYRFPFLQIDVFYD
jgi:hypothetical protein